MGNKVESCQALGIGSKGYLYFDDALYVGSTPDEEHEEILTRSGRLIAEVVVAGGILVSGNGIVIDGEGSSSLAIEGRDPTPVAKFIRVFPDADGKIITPVKR